MKKSFLFLADGFEEVEALGTLDVLRRGGAEVCVVSIYGRKEVEGAHGIVVVADLLLKDIDETDVEFLILPGGMPGAQHLSESSLLMDILKKHFEKKKPIAAICAAPALVLGKLPLDKSVRMTCYPGFEKYLPGIDVLQEGVVIDGDIITGRGPAYAFDFGFAILTHLTGSREAALGVKVGMLLK